MQHSSEATYTDSANAPKLTAPSESCEPDFTQQAIALRRFTALKKYFFLLTVLLTHFKKKMYFVFLVIGNDPDVSQKQ